MSAPSYIRDPRVTDRVRDLPLVSVVTPAYNEEEHISECIESVLAQTYQNWEYTIVDNSSTDRTLTIAQEYASRDSRIRVRVNEVHISAIPNFNLALRQISPQSKYCKMVLADDALFPECIERMVDVAEKYPSVGVVGAYGIANPWVVWGGLPYPGEFLSGREICRKRLLGGPYVFGSQTSVLFRSHLVRSRDPFYNEENPAADSEACFVLLKNSDFGFVHQVLTFSRERPNSLLEESRALNTAAFGALHELIAYGPHFLSPQEYSSRLATIVSKYYEFLAASLLQRRPKKFWQYHKQKLNEEGIGFTRTKIVQAFGRRLWDRILGVARVSDGKYWGLERS